MVLNYRAIIKLSGFIIDLLALLMLPSLLVSYIYGEVAIVKCFIVTIIPIFILGTILVLIVKADLNNLKIREGYMIVALCWILGSIFGCIPFILSGYIPNFADAFFETVSGFTTTGSTILIDIEVLPKGLLFWRSFTHWIGGMGIIVFAIALLPALGISGQKIAKAETTGPTFGKITSKVSESAKILYLIYVGFTVVEIILLYFGGMNLYDSMIHTFGSIGTGGFSNYNASISYFDSLYIDLVITIFMLLAGTNFSLYYHVLTGRWKDFFSDGELRLYLLIVSVSVLLIALNLWFSGIYHSIGQAFRYSLFQSSSIMTTTGFATADFDLWPTFSKMILFFLMFIGGCSSSTAGGIKVIRILLIFKLMKRGIGIRLHPRAVIAIKINDRPIPADTISAVANFIYLYLLIFFAGTVLLSLENLDLLTTLSSVAACLGNIGPGFSLIGPVLNYSFYSDPSKFLLAGLMLIGRLELFTIILLFTRQFWNPDK